MGRGASKAGGGSLAGGGGGGLTANNLPPVTNQVIPPTPQQVANGDTTPQGGVPFSDFKNMTDDEKADVVTAALSTGTPMFLDDSGLQRFAYYTGMSDKPTVVSDSQLDQMKGVSLYRTVNDSYNSSTDIGYTATDICKQISTGDFTMYSDSGGSAYGKGIYFADDYADSSWYGNGRGSKTMRAKVTGGKMISGSQASANYQNALNKGDKLAIACSKADRSSASNLYNLCTGVDVIKNGSTGNAYYVVLNRGALSVSSTVKDTKRGGSW